MVLPVSVLAHGMLVFALAGMSMPVEQPAEPSRSAIIRVHLASFNVPDEPEEIPEERPEPEDVPNPPREPEEPMEPPSELPEKAADELEAFTLVKPMVKIPEREEKPEPVDQEPVPELVTPPLEVFSVPAVEPSRLETENETSYWESVRGAVAGKIRYPSTSRRGGVQDTIVLRIVIDASGGLLDVEAIPPRGDAALTRAALRAVHLAAPFDPPSRFGLGGAFLTAELPIRFQIRV